MFRAFFCAVLFWVCCPVEFVSAGGLAELVAEYGGSPVAYGQKTVPARFATLQTPAPAVSPAAQPGASLAQLAAMGGVNCPDGTCNAAAAAPAPLAVPQARPLLGRTSAQALRRTRSDCSTGGCDRR